MAQTAILSRRMAGGGQKVCVLFPGYKKYPSLDKTSPSCLYLPGAEKSLACWSLSWGQHGLEMGEVLGTGDYSAAQWTAPRVVL